MRFPISIRKNPDHFEKFSHPGDSSYDEDEAKFSRETGKTGVKKTVSPDAKPPLREKGEESS